MQQPSPRSTAPRQPRSGKRGRRIAAVAALGLTGLIAGLLSGCGNGISPTAAATASSSASATPTAQYTAASGNWLFTTPSARLTSLSGSLSVTGATVTGTLHPLLAACITNPASFAVAGTIAPGGVLTLSSSNFAGGTVSIQGTLSSDLHSLSNPTITVTGGSCATSHALPGLQPRDNTGSTAQQYQALTGNYSGTLVSSYGGTLAVSAAISQGASPDSSGNYHLTGTATFADQSCVSSPVITDSIISGNTVSTTYTDPNTGNSVTGTGTFSADAQTLSISTWTLSGNCGSDHGSGTLTRH